MKKCTKDSYAFTRVHLGNTSTPLCCEYFILYQKCHLIKRNRKEGSLVAERSMSKAEMIKASLAEANLVRISSGLY